MTDERAMAARACSSAALPALRPVCWSVVEVFPRAYCQTTTPTKTSAIHAHIGSGPSFLVSGFDPPF